MKIGSWVNFMSPRMVGAVGVERLLESVVHMGQS